MPVDVSFSLSPEGVEEVFQVMVKVIPEKPFEVFASTWGKVLICLDSSEPFDQTDRWGIRSVTFAKRFKISLS